MQRKWPALLTRRRMVRLLLALCIVWQGWYVAWVVRWKWVNPEQTHFMALRLESLREKNPRAQLKYHWVAYQHIADSMKRAVIAAEDDKFVDHDGFDWDGILQALRKNERRGRISAGGSTITQQLAKNLFLSPARTPWRKAQEALITVWLELFWDKRRILEVYLNVVEWGQGLFGVDAAAHHYFHTDAAHLAENQAVLLAVMLPAPRRFEKNPYSAYLDNRSQIILERMRTSAVP